MYILCMCIYVYYVCIYYVTYIIYIVCEGGREGGRDMYTEYRSMHIVLVDRNACVYRLELSLSLSLALSRLKRLDSLSLSSEKTWLSLLSCHLNTLGSGSLAAGPDLQHLRLWLSCCRSRSSKACMLATSSSSSLSAAAASACLPLTARLQLLAVGSQ